MLAEKAVYIYICYVIWTGVIYHAFPAAREANRDKIGICNGHSGTDLIKFVARAPMETQILQPHTPGC